MYDVMAGTTWMFYSEHQARAIHLFAESGLSSTDGSANFAGTRVDEVGPIQ
jgi:hypothetical protein